MNRKKFYHSARLAVLVLLLLFGIPLLLFADVQTDIESPKIEITSPANDVTVEEYLENYLVFYDKMDSIISGHTPEMGSGPVTVSGPTLVDGGVNFVNDTDKFYFPFNSTTNNYLSKGTITFEYRSNATVGAYAALIGHSVNYGFRLNRYQSSNTQMQLIIGGHWLLISGAPNVWDGNKHTFQISWDTNFRMLIIDGKVYAHDRTPYTHTIGSTGNLYIGQRGNNTLGCCGTIWNFKMFDEVILPYGEYKTTGNDSIVDYWDGSSSTTLKNAAVTESGTTGATGVDGETNGAVQSDAQNETAFFDTSMDGSKGNIAFWFKSTVPFAGDTQYFCGNDSTPNFFIRTKTIGTADYYVNLNIGIECVLRLTSLHDGNWHYLQFYWNAAAPVRGCIYDGRKVEDTRAFTPVNMSNYRMYVGSGNSTHGGAGIIDNFTITNNPNPQVGLLPTIMGKPIASSVSSATYETGEPTITVSGTASDNVGVTAVTWTNSTGGSGTASGTNNWTITDIPLANGENIITLTVRDSGNNTRSKTLIVTQICTTPVSITTPPADQTVTEGESATFAVVAEGAGLTYQWQENGFDIAGATAATYTTSSTSLSDNGSQFNCVLSRSGCPSVPSGIATLTVNEPPPDMEPPAIEITVPTTESIYETIETTIAVSGTASDNVGVTAVTWTNSAGGSGTASGTDSWIISTLALSEGENLITVTAKDENNNEASISIIIVYVIPVGEKMAILIQSDNAEGDTNFADTSGNKHDIIGYGNAHHSTAEKKFGLSSIYFDGDGDFLSIPDSYDWNFGGGDFTIDFWVRPSNASGYYSLLSHHNSGSANQSDWWLYMNNGEITFLGCSDGTCSNSAYATTTGAGLVNNEWKHIGVVRNNKNLRIYVNGILKGENTNYTLIHRNADTDLIVGANLNSDAPEHYFAGYIDELRITKGAALWTENTFTPPGGLPKLVCVGCEYSDRIVIYPDGSVTIGDTAPKARLTVNGIVAAKEFIVKPDDWADYVFSSAYSLLPISEMESYVKQHNHLPGIPSEAELKDQSVSISDLMENNMKKIEELTLYLIQIKKKNERLSKQLDILENK